MPYPLSGNALNATVFKEVAVVPRALTGPVTRTPAAGFPRQRSVVVRKISIPAVDRMVTAGSTAQPAIRVWGGQMSSGIVTVEHFSRGVNVYVETAELEITTSTPVVYAAHGKDITVEIGPTRTDVSIAETRGTGNDVGPTRTFLELGATRTKWALGVTRKRNQFEVDYATRGGLDVGDTRVQRGR